jgi:hypothetical protein
MKFNEFSQKLDLEPINFLMSEKAEGPNWTIEKTQETEKLYRKFLYLSFMYPDKMIVPTKDIDDYWHHHILDTKKYMNDCMNCFNSFFHHYPYLGTKGDELELYQLFDETDKLFSKHFKEKLIGENSACGGGGGSCGGSRGLITIEY